jgi:hypothetical protein
LCSHDLVLTLVCGGGLCIAACAHPPAHG